MRRHIAWGIAALDIVALLAESLVYPALGAGGAVIYGAGIASFSAVGALLLTRVPANPIGPLLLAAGTALPVALGLVTYGDIGGGAERLWPGSGAARLVGQTLFLFPFVIALIGVPLVFPDGHLPSRRFRWVVVTAVAGLVAWTFGGLSGAAPQDGSTDVDPGFAVLQLLVVGALLTGFGGAVVAIWIRFRRGNPVQREQIKWLVAVVGVGALVLPLSLLPVQGSPELASVLTNLTLLTLFALPVVIGIAILRYQLFEIDRIVSRTIGWAVVSGVLVAVFAATVVGLQGLLADVTQGQTLAVAASTLAALVLFQPIRRRVQSAVDRRFDRARYDGQRTVDAFSVRMRSEIDLAKIRTALLATAHEAVRPVGAAIWMRSDGRAIR